MHLCLQDKTSRRVESGSYFGSVLRGKSDFTLLDSDVESAHEVLGLVLMEIKVLDTLVLQLHEPSEAIEHN